MLKRAFEKVCVKDVLLIGAKIAFKKVCGKYVLNMWQVCVGDRCLKDPLKKYVSSMCCLLGHKSAFKKVCGKYVLVIGA